MRMNNLLFSPGGYRLAVFQLYNWGVFDKVIYTLDCNGKSSLLTGENGSGKTTIVDALVSLLVPPQLRYYNQSSGTDRKRDRTEETYVLGAYGNRQDEQTSGIKAESLRDRDSFSVLSGCFVNDGQQSAVSLLQVRYFSGDGLQHVFAVTKQRVSIEDIQVFLKSNGLAIDRKGDWKRAVSSQFGTVFFDSFSRYSDAFSTVFGFRSDKALKLFSQTVGLKVLGSLTEFIRTNMLEDFGTEKQFEELEMNYRKLMESYNVIQKTKKQIELLQPVIDTGVKWKKAQSDKQTYDLFNSVIPLWYADCALVLYEAEESDLRNSCAAIEADRTVTINRQTDVQKEIDSLNIALAQNETARHITGIRNHVEQLEMEKQRIQAARSQHEKRLHLAGLSLPETEAQFLENLSNIKKLVQAKAAESKVNDENLFKARTTNNELSDQCDRIKNELESLGKRTSNIPLENITLRARICSAAGCRESDLPFAGELIRVAPEEALWSASIEKLLHNFALDILVSPALYEKVTTYIKNTDMNGRIVYLRTDERFVLHDGENREPDKTTVPGKLETKKDHPLSGWISGYVRDHFNYRCTDDIAEIRREQQVITSTGLIKSGIRHEKDDRKKHSASSVHVLGWDNTEKKRELSSAYDDLQRSIAQSVAAMDSLESRQENISAQTLNLQMLSEESVWDAIDTERRAQQIDALTDEIHMLESRADDIRELNSQLDRKKLVKKQYADDLERIDQRKGLLDGRLKAVAGKIEQSTAAWSHIPDSEKQNERIKINDLVSCYPDHVHPRTAAELDILQAALHAENNMRSDECARLLTKLESSLVKLMQKIKNPDAETRTTYHVDWSSEFTDLGEDPDALPDYESALARLQTDDLPRYTEKFSAYLHDTMNQDIIDFNQFIQNKTQEITAAIANLNASLKAINYDQNSDTFLELEAKSVSDVRIKEFRALLRAAVPDAYYGELHDDEFEQKEFQQIKILLDRMQKNESDRRFVLDVRNWFSFSAKERYTADKAEKRMYENTASLSGGEKAKLTYTILASAIAYQFGITSDKEGASSFRFVIIDEAFSKSDSFNSDYAMNLFKQLELQLMVITPFDKINIVENYISSVHITENCGNHDSRLLHMTIEEYTEMAQREKLHEGGAVL
jgi:uncharacterized protein YPO0396